MTVARNPSVLNVLFAAQGALFWVPVFALVFSAHLSAADVLALEGVYYLAVVGLEVPSGWLSDRLGRRPTLVLSGLAWMLGAVAIAGGTTFAVFAVGQVLLAGGRAFASGTDSAILYESLVATGDEDRFRERLGTAVAWNFGALAVSAVVGGALGALDLRLPYVASAVSGLVALGAAVALVEPPHAREASVGFGQAIRTAWGRPRVRWVFAVVAAMTVFTHIPYEVQQPWLQLTLGVDAAAMASGAIVACSFGAASLGSRRAAAWGDRFGFDGVLAASMVFLAVVMGVLALGPYAWAAPLLAIRSLPTGLLGPLADAEVHPHLDSSIRATWLSVQSLAGRLAFALVLFVASSGIGETWTMEALRRLLVPGAAAAFGFALVVALRRRT